MAAAGGGGSKRVIQREGRWKSDVCKVRMVVIYSRYFWIRVSLITVFTVVLLTDNIFLIEGFPCPSKIKELSFSLEVCTKCD